MSLDINSMIPPSPVESKSTERAGCVLIVDDNEDACEVLAILLNSLGLCTEIAKNGEEAIDRIKDHPPSLIFLDLMMPRLNGFGVLTWLHSNPATKHTPVILVTALTSQQLTTQMAPNIIGVIQKGRFDAARIRDLIAQALGQLDSAD